MTRNRYRYRSVALASTLNLDSRRSDKHQREIRRSSFVFQSHPSHSARRGLLSGLAARSTHSSVQIMYHAQVLVENRIAGVTYHLQSLIPLTRLPVGEGTKDEVELKSLRAEVARLTENCAILRKNLEQLESVRLSFES